MSTTAASARDPQIGFVRTTANRRLPTAHRHLALFVQPFFNRLPTTGYCIVVTTSTIRIGANGTKETFSGKKRKRTQKEDSRRCAASFASSCGSCVSGARGLAPRWLSRVYAVSTYYRRFTKPACSIRINIPSAKDARSVKRQRRAEACPSKFPKPNLKSRGGSGEGPRPRPPTTPPRQRSPVRHRAGRLSWAEGSKKGPQTRSIAFGNPTAHQRTPPAGGYDEIME